ncbi:hypothetical protein OIDMADRAFT_136518 [Oidiodendron maius Zn]|uniref:Zn(2)-C6 fungal-type domain-containing protein n=1 Tax=Oidiodendron maius (strain Zn) TaxID=913774 RepID=A0A0C3GV76_OIDMZ|nr:hypothetical protein OIDMADRAFT_136518 [Oidiodendron maius Zn]
MDSVHSLHQPPSRHHGPRIASRVCTPCALRKRKCDKTLPRCMTCTKIKKICHYGTPAPSPSDNFQPPTKANEDRQKSSPEGPASSPRTVLYNSAVDLNVPLTSYLYLRDPFRLPEARRSIVNATIAKDVSKIVGTVDEVKSTALDYFNSIHPWMPVVSRTRFFSRLPQIWLNPQADFILLAFCMFLVIQIPGQDHLESMQSSLYAMAKGLIALVESADILSIEVVQTRLLVSIYELGHGIDSGAFISIGACARSGIALGIHRTLQQQAPGDAQSWVELEEQRRVWWGIYILDQFANLDKIDRPPTFTDLTYLDYLPVDDEEWNNNIMPSGGPLTVSTSSSIRVGCFAREAQLSHLLSRVLRNVYDASPNPAFNREEALQLHRALDTMTALLPTESAEIRKVYAAVISMCHRYDILLLEYNKTNQKPDY